MLDHKKPTLQNNWGRILLYLFLCIVAILLFSIPVVPWFWDVIQDQNKNITIANQGYEAAIQTVVTLAIVAATWLMITQLEYRTLEFYRLTFEKKLLLKGFAIGALIMVVFALFALVSGVVEFNYVGISMKLFASFFVYTLVAIGEEVLVRGYILTNLQEKMNPFLALLVSSLFFGILHFGNDHFTWIGVATISFSGFLLGFLTLKTGSISTAIGLHWSWNFVQGPLLGFAVSGHQELGIVRPTPLSSALFTGGEFGAEASLLLLGLILLIVVLGCYFFADKKFFFGSKRVFTIPEFSEEK